jgi:hypothetical protein
MDKFTFTVFSKYYNVFDSFQAIDLYKCKRCGAFLVRGGGEEDDSIRCALNFTSVYFFLAYLMNFSQMQRL